MSGSDQVVQDDALDGLERELLESESARLGSDDASVSRATARLVVDRFRAHERQRRVLVTAGSVLSLAALAALVVGLQKGGDAAHVAQNAPAVSLSSLVVESGGVAVPGVGAVPVGQPVAAGVTAELTPGTCLRAGSSVRLCSKSGAKLRLPALGAAWDIELAGGALSADLAAMPAGFSVRTQHGRAAVVGTLFSMELDAARAFTTVAVERGTVSVHNARTGEDALLWIGQQARLGERLEVLGSRADAPAERATDAHAAELPAESHVGAQSARSAAPAAPGGKTPADLLEEAREQRGSRHYTQAAQLYRKLVQQHPQSAEARAALVSLGQLELGQLGQPEAALRSFQAYLARPGQLRQEAEHGVIQALQKLGRKAEERRAIEAFLSRYPKSTQAGPLSERLKQL